MVEHTELHFNAANCLTRWFWCGFVWWFTSLNPLNILSDISWFSWFSVIEWLTMN